MQENPYASPLTPPPAVGVLSGKREDLHRVAMYQKGILICILVYILAVIVQFLLPENVRFLLQIGVLGVGLVATIFVFLLAMKVYHPVVGILVALLTLVPCLGLIVLLMINGKATSILRQNGLKVGLLGADLSQVAR